MEKFTLKNTDTKTNVERTYTFDEEFDYVSFSLKYSPLICDDEEKCLPEIYKALDKYYEGTDKTYTKEDALKFVPISNLIAMSIEKDGIFLGNAHRKDNDQENIITTSECSRGFVPPKTIKGTYKITLHLHMIFTEECDIILDAKGGYYA